MAHLRSRNHLLCAVSGFGLMIAATVSLVVPMRPAAAQFTVFDPSNYSQNLLTAARTLQQVNNQIKALQNQAQSLINQAKNLSTIGFPELQSITQALQQINQLMGQAQDIQFKVATLNQDFQRLFPTTFSRALTNDQHVADAKARMDTAMASFEQTMSVQAQVVENVQADAATLNGLVARSQGAEGALQAAQATNQLLALSAKQQFQIQNLMAAQYRAQAIEQASRVQSQTDARAATAKFLGSGTAYTPH
ncbi:MAG: P-type conjugative transfer protein TrbJ [Sphingomonadales bacterium]|nr:P-type conjugative transfer protein TrbJ [Sphingomonadales bacterium]